VPSPEPASSRVRVEVVEGEDAGWTQFVAAHPDATLYHTLAWREVLVRSFGYRSWCLKAVSEDTGETVGVLPLYLVAAPFGRHLSAVPFRDRGGPLWTEAAAFPALVAAARQAASSASASGITFKTVTAYPEALTAAAGLTERRYWIRSAVTLADFAATPLWQRLGPKRRSPIRQAQDAGMTCDGRVADADTWYQLHLQTQQRLGLPPFPERFFRVLLERLVPSGAAQLLVARQGGTALAATILLKHGPVVTYGYAATASDGRQAAGDLVLYSAMASAIDEGASTFDMGSDAPSQTGLLFFKRRWFAQQAAIPSYTIGRTGGGADSSSAHYRLLRRGFQFLPIPLLRLTSRATKYFG